MVKLYNNQVFVADNIKEVIPEFLLLLKGVIDCPDLPLNVSRSFLQNDGYVKKMAAYITRKVADRLISEFNNQREDYQRYWDDIHPFVKYGCMQRREVLRPREEGAAVQDHRRRLSDAGGIPQRATATARNAPSTMPATTSARRR